MIKIFRSGEYGMRGRIGTFSVLKAVCSGRRVCRGIVVMPEKLPVS